MLNFRTKGRRTSAFMAGIVFMSMLAPLLPIRAADHAESTSVGTDAAADIGDLFAFLNPTDNTKVVLAMTVEGFIVPSEAANLGYFAPDVLYRFEIENTGDAVADQRIDITFSPQTARNVPQTATIVLPKAPNERERRITAPTTIGALGATAPPFNVTTNATAGVRFFAGLTDDPFYFDIPAFGRFVTSVLAGTPDVTRLNRSRDSFAGQNIPVIATEVPSSLLKGPGKWFGFTSARRIELGHDEGVLFVVRDQLFDGFFASQKLIK